MFTPSMSSGIILTRKTDLSIDKLTVKNAKRKTLLPNATSYKKIGNRLADQFHGTNTRNNPTGKKKECFLLSVRLLSKMKRVNQIHSLKYLTTWPFEK
jgi:hypothetical protein